MKYTPNWSAPALKKLGIIAGAVLLGLSLVLAAGYWLVVPGVADSLVRDKLKSTEAKLGLNVQVDRVQTDGVSAVSLVGFRIVDPESDKPLLSTDSVSASVNALALLFGNRELSGVEVENATFYLHKYADGSTNIDEILARRRAEKGAEAPEPSKKDEPAGRDPEKIVESFLRFFGGNWPDISVHKAQLKTSADEDAEPWAVELIESDELSLASRGKRALFKTQLAITRGQGLPSWSIPGAIEIDAELKLPLGDSTGALKFDRPLALSGVGPYPFLRAGIGGLSVEDKYKITLEALSLGLQGKSAPIQLVSVEKIQASFHELKLPLRELRLTEAEVVKPRLTLEYDAQSANGLNDLNQLIRAPLARQIASSARQVAETIAEEKGLEIDDDEPASGGLRAMLAEVNWSKFLAKKAPQSLRITDASVRVKDARELGLLGADKNIALEDGQLKFSHRVINGKLVLDSSFKATGESAAPRGEASLKLSWNYRKDTLDLKAQVDRLSLPWVAQMSSARLADKIRAGDLHADIELKREEKKKRVDFSGLISVEDATLFSAAIAEEPISRLSASYKADGFYDPTLGMPEPELIKPLIAAADQPDPQDPGAQPNLDDATPPSDDDADQEDDEDQPPTRGALVINAGHFELNGVSGEFRPALYGLDGFKRRPNRLTTHIDLPQTPVMTLFDAVPAAIKGPIEGTRMSGEFSWTLDLEVPLYHAGDMQWRAKPELLNFELLSMPPEVDVRKLTDEFQMTIYDPAIEWSREVTIPEMRPMPMEWMITQTGISEEEFEQRQHRRGWPTEEDFEEYTEPHRLPWQEERREQSPGFGLNSPLDPEADMGWEEPAPSPEPPPPPEQYPPDEIPPELLVILDEEEQEHPYGPYVFVPLQYSSPWMIRAAMTTEDNSFFKHGGFNWLAVRESISANLNAGSYVRGASTISMQLVKNIFLTRDKVMVRKLREAFLVWLMEDVVRVPKARILELYFNVIEYGPGIFGIHDAAVHYFGKHPDKLTLGEVAFLVSIVPNPKKFHFYYERGELSDSWHRRMMRYVRYMVTRERATEEDYEEALAHKPAFYKPKDGEPMIKMERDPDEVEDLMDDNLPMRIPGLRDLFSP